MRTFTKAEYVLAMAEDIFDQRAAYEELKSGHKAALGAAALAGAGAIGHHIGYGAGKAAAGGDLWGRAGSFIAGGSATEGIRALKRAYDNNPAAQQLGDYLGRKFGVKH